MGCPAAQFAGQPSGSMAVRQHLHWYIQPFVRRNVWPTGQAANQTLIRLQGGTARSMTAPPAGYAVSRLPVCFYFCLFHRTINYLSVYIIIRLFA
jgi:hypothetical protein